MPDLLVLCPHDCNLMIKLSDISRHIESAHDNITGTCNYCNEDIRIRDWQDHLEICKPREFDDYTTRKLENCNAIHHDPDGTMSIKKKMSRYEMTKCNDCKKMMLKRNFNRHLDNCLPSKLRGKRIIVTEDGKFEMPPEDHVGVVYKNAKTFTVLECGREFSDFMCNKCGKTMPKSNLRRHSKIGCERSNLVQLATCEVCKKILKAETMKLHMKICNAPRKENNCPLSIDHEEVIEHQDQSAPDIGELEINFLIPGDLNAGGIIIIDGICDQEEL